MRFTLGLFLALALFRVEAAELLSVTEVATIIDTDAAPLILDVRSEVEFSSGRVPGAVNIPFDQITARVSELEPYRNQALIVYCHSGRRADIAITSLEGLGFSRLLHMDGDYLGWQAAGLSEDK
ncbi:MAG: rhodanese-like domain-containing protein [Pseudomonadales bacterium]